MNENALINIDGSLMRPDQLTSEGVTAAQLDASRRARAHAESAQRRAHLTGEIPDILREMKIVWSRPQLGDARSQMLREMEVEEALKITRFHWSVAPGSYVILRDGRRISAGQEITMRDVDDYRPAMSALISREVVLVIPPHEVFVRNLSSEHGPHVWAGKKPKTLADGRVIAIGATIKEEDLRPAPEPKPVDPIQEALMLMRGVSAPPNTPESEFAAYLRIGKILRNPNYRPTPKGGKAAR